MLSVAVAAVESSASISYDISKITEIVDFINIKTFHLHGPWDTKVGINAPMYTGPSDLNDFERQFNVYSCLKYWIQSGK